MYKDRIQDINARLKAKGFASINWVAGIGSYSYQMVTRDTFASAVKATYVVINGVGRNIQKDPETDDGTKKSATGQLAVLSQANGVPYLVEQATEDQRANSLLKTVWENGKFVRAQAFVDIRANLKRNTEIFRRAGVI
jgi:nicotinamide phosphoribosyltransferase